MAVVFALLHLFDAVVARFEAEGTAVPQTFGWLATSEQMSGASRIVWIPGDEGGGLGAVGPAKYPGRNPRPLANLGELCTVEITASAAGGERAQYQAARELFDAWYRAVYLAAHGTFTIVSAKWVLGDRARRFGATMRVVLSVQAPVFDLPIQIAPVVGAAASLNLTQLDVTEHQDVSAEEPA